MPQIDTFSNGNSVFSGLTSSLTDNNQRRRVAMTFYPRSWGWRIQLWPPVPRKSCPTASYREVAFGIFYLAYLMEIRIDTLVAFPVYNDLFGIWEWSPYPNPRTTGPQRKATVHLVSQVIFQTWNNDSHWTDHILFLLEFKVRMRQSSPQHYKAKARFCKLRSCEWSFPAT